ncbi:hypothetical protein LH464_16265 [Neorhizobium sp. T786]|uniref:tetratricopeptide repeat protein n=1 Tax=Pseudorhizobium xiangyangii TaxID=2883104 RepID=UPI001CFFFC78|nr:hypothetical protein [Neorhizobium xiangyangii]MCB5204023.1 hypothetical protein [Neorhizobium xiangyangii]
MNAGEDQDAVREVSEAEARAELDRLLSDPRFHATDRAKNVLRYIAERYFEGQTEGVKAYAIALDVLGRSPRFDPNTDPIVRIELSRLRSALGAYYEAYGPELEISIQLPIGRYLTIFSKSSSTLRATEEGEGEDMVDLAPTQEHSPRLFGRKIRGMTSGVIALGVIGAGWLLVDQRAVMTLRPTVTIDVVAAEASHQEEANLLNDYLVTALSKFRTVNIVAKREFVSTAAPAIQPRTQMHTYSIELKYYADSGDRSVWWRAVDGQNGGVLASGVERVLVDGRSGEAVRDEVVSILARKLAATRGVISNLETHDEQDKAVLGNTCVLRAEYELDEGRQSDVRHAKICLERTLQIQPGNSDAAAALARVLMDADLGELKPETLDRAGSLARRAVSLDPMSDRAYIALMMTQFYTGSTEAAIAAGNQALSLNPHNPDVLAKLAIVLFNSGYRDAAVSLAQDASRNVNAIPGDARLVLALDAYSKGNYSNASLMAEQISRVDVVIAALKVAALAEVRSPAARGGLHLLASVMPGYRTELVTWMKRRNYDPVLIASLQRSLSKVGQATSPGASAIMPSHGERRRMLLPSDLNLL